MTISKRIRSQFFEPTSFTTTVDSGENAEKKLIRLPRNSPPRPSDPRRASRSKRGASRRNPLAWSDEEHDRFLQGLEIFPTGPWKEVAAFVGTRTTRQTMTHAQKYRQKIMRRQRRLRTPVRNSAPAIVAASAAVDAEKKESASNTSTSTTKSARVSKLSTATAASKASSPSSSDQLVGDCKFDLGCIETAYGSASSTMTTSVSTDECSKINARLEDHSPNQLGLDESMIAFLDDLEDPIALFFDDPNSYDGVNWPQKTASAYPPQWSPGHPTDPVATPYECLL